MKTLLSLATLLLCAASVSAKDYKVASPNGRIQATIHADKVLCYDIANDGQDIMTGCQLGLRIRGQQFQTAVKSAKQQHLIEHVDAFLYRQKAFDTECNQLTLQLAGGISIQFRAYDEGVAYRYLLNQKGKRVIIEGEEADFHFVHDFPAWLPYSTNAKKPTAMAFQATYAEGPISTLTKTWAFLPATVDCGSCKVTLMESDLESYPGMFVQAEGTALKGVFAAYPDQMDYYPGRKQMYVSTTHDYIAEVQPRRNLPWRVLGISHDDCEMPVNNLVYALATPSKISDTSWIRGGKVAWDWWNGWGLTGVDFKAGINMETYKYHIDFASKFGLEYVVLDEGWYDPKSGDMLTTVPEINLPELIQYGKQKGVGIILWTVFNVLDDQLEQACKKYSEMGAVGFKVDFLDRDDQTAVEMAYRIAEKCAQYHMTLDYHGMYKPTGLNRTWPNVINYESVFGMEEVKWTKHDEQDMPRYDVTFPFIRQQCGYVDFTPGGMRNATRVDFQPVYYNPMTMGTRAHQAAMYIVHDSPLTMLADAPTAYEAEPEYTRFLAAMPTEYDRTLVPQGKMGEYIVLVREHAGKWYVGGQTNWDARDITLKFDFLPAGKTFQATLVTDGLNANKNASDYRITTQKIKKDDSLSIHLASGGGFAIELK